MSVPKRFIPRLAAAMAIKAGLLLLLLLPAPLPYFSAAVQAQSPALMLMAQDELQKRGLNESEVRARLLEKGINPETIPPAEYPKYESQVRAVLDELQAEKRAAATTASGQNQNAGQTIQINVDLPVRNKPGRCMKQPTVGTPAEMLPATTPESRRRSRPACHSGRSRAGTGSGSFEESTFTAIPCLPTRAWRSSVPPTGLARTAMCWAGDEIHISIFGASQTDISTIASTAPSA